MKKILINENGHTLIEMTVVLFIVTIISSISFVHLEKTYNSQTRNQFISQLEQDLYYAQQMAISNQQIVNVSFLNGSKAYVIRQNTVAIIRRNYQYENTTVVQGTMSLGDISFLPNGHVSKSGTLLIVMGEYRYRLVMLMGRGRFYIEQL